MLILLLFLSLGGLLLFHYCCHNLSNLRPLVLSRPLLQPQFDSLSYSLRMLSTVLPCPQPGIVLRKKWVLIKTRSPVLELFVRWAWWWWWAVLQVSNCDWQHPREEALKNSGMIAIQLIRTKYLLCPSRLLRSNWDCRIIGGGVFEELLIVLHSSVSAAFLFGLGAARRM